MCYKNKYTFDSAVKEQFGYNKTLLSMFSHCLQKAELKPVQTIKPAPRSSNTEWMNWNCIKSFVEICISFTVKTFFSEMLV